MVAMKMLYMFLLLVCGFVKSEGLDCLKDVTDPWIEGTVSKHNELRALHQDTDDICYNMGLQSTAQVYANKLAAANEADPEGTKQFLEHDPDIVGEGENLCMVSTKMFQKKGDKHCFIKCANAWYYTEEPGYDYNYPEDNYYELMYLGHFTQEVWKSTKYVGCAIAKGANRVYVVCRYSPEGNWKGEFANNIGNPV